MTRPQLTVTLARVNGRALPGQDHYAGYGHRQGYHDASDFESQMYAIQLEAVDFPNRK